MQIHRDFAYADYSELADALDKEKNLSIAEKYDICAVMSDQSDIAIPTVAYIADKLGLPGIGIEKAKLFSNKVLMREFLKSHNLIYPKFKSLQNNRRGREVFAGGWLYDYKTNR